jgi:hypothetical protein
MHRHAGKRYFRYAPIVRGTRNPTVPSSPAAVTADVQRPAVPGSERAASLSASLSRGRRDEAGPGPATVRYKALGGAKNRSGGACEVAVSGGGAWGAGGTGGEGDQRWSLWGFRVLCGFVMALRDDAGLTTATWRDHGCAVRGLVGRPRPGLQVLQVRHVVHEVRCMLCDGACVAGCEQVPWEETPHGRCQHDGITGRARRGRDCSFDLWLSRDFAEQRRDGPLLDRLDHGEGCALGA